ncbi:MAG: TetR/AcrR family transcriptional regulator [Eubacteriales bacterium]
MNDKFFSLPEEKQTAMLNAGYRVFARNSYRKSPMREIAEAAGISKALLFHYFRNKKELYLFLWDKGAQITAEALTRYGCYQAEDLFEAMYMGTRAKIGLMRQYPDLTAFTLKAFYEKDPEVCTEIQRSIAKHAAFKEQANRLKIRPERFREGLDLQMMYREMYLASEGYLWEKLQQGEINVDEVERDFMRMIRFWESVYLREPENHG